MSEPGQLIHSGIKDMKWGVRRYQNPDGSLTEEGKLRYKKHKDSEIDKSEIKNWKKSDSKHLSDEELRNRVARLLQESQYKRLLTELNSPEVKKKKEHPLFKQIFITSAATAMATVVSSLAKDTIQNKIAKAIVSDPKKFEEFMKNKENRKKVFGN